MLPLRAAIPVENGSGLPPKGVQRGPAACHVMGTSRFLRGNMMEIPHTLYRGDSNRMTALKPTPPTLDPRCEIPPDLHPSWLDRSPWTVQHCPVIASRAMARTRGFFHDETPKIATVVIWKMINHRTIGSLGYKSGVWRTNVRNMPHSHIQVLFWWAKGSWFKIDLSFRVFLARIKLISDRAVKILSIKLCYALLLKPVAYSPQAHC